MEVEIRLFGNLGHYLPDGGNRFSFTLSLVDGATVHDMLTTLKLPEEMSIIAIINGRQADRSHVLRDHDEVNIFRPSGGG